MAQDPDVIKVAGLYETRGRRSKSQKARTLTETLKGFEATAKGLTRSLDFALPLGLFAFSTWTTRLRVEVVRGITTFQLRDAAGLVYAVVQPTFQGKSVQEIRFVHPELFAAEGMGMLTILMSMPGSDIIGLVENGLALGIYHVFLNGGKFTIPGGTGKITAFDPVALSLIGALGVLGLFIVLASPTSDPSAPATLNIQGLFPSVTWKLGEMQANLQREIDAGRMALPTGLGLTPLEPIVRRVQVDSIIKGLAHSAFLTLLLKRGGGVVPTE